MALTVEFARALPLYPHGNFLQWDLKGVTETGVYLFDFYRAGSSEGPWETVFTSSPDVFNHRDTFPAAQPVGTVVPDQLALSRYICYKVVATPPSGAANAVYAVTPIEPFLDGRQKMLKRKILRDQAVALRKLNGIEVAILKRKHWGTRCTKCFDKYTKELVRGNCNLCYGVGYINGYYDPIVTLARRGTTAVHSPLSPQGTLDVTSTQMVVLDVPKVTKDDILVSLQDNRRFLVQSVQPTELRTVVVYQTLTVSELARSSIEYRVLVDPYRVPRLF